MILENKAKDNLESPKEFAESVFGISFGIPVRYVRIPEVEVGDPIYFLEKQFKNVLSDSVPSGKGGEGVVPNKE